MAQNIYDDPEFFERYVQFPRQQLGLEGAAEWPLVRSLLPSMDGVRALDLGCGFGWFARWALRQRAASVHGIDASQRMLDRAIADSATEIAAGTVSYQRADLETVDLPTDGFDLAHSSLTLHYIVDLGQLFAKVRSALIDGGSFVFTCEHPIFTAPSIDRPVEVDGTRVWPLNRYSDEGERVRSWLSDGVIKQHRTVATHINLLIEHGFVIDHVAEFGPGENVVAAEPGFAIDRDRPAFLIVKATAV